jgi:hypothetical protein
MTLKIERYKPCAKRSTRVQNIRNRREEPDLRDIPAAFIAEKNAYIIVID